MMSGPVAAALAELEGHTYALRRALLMLGDEAERQANRVTLGEPYEAERLGRAVIAINHARKLHAAAGDALGKAMAAGIIT